MVGDVIGRGVEMVNIVRVVAGHMQYVIADEEELKGLVEEQKVRMRWRVLVRSSRNATGYGPC